MPMANRRTTFDKLQRERAKKAKAAAKRDRRMERAELAAESDAPENGAGDAERKVDAAQLLETIDLIHRQLDAGQIGRDEFEERKAELLARLPID
jgi:hypothetical protein